MDRPRPSALAARSLVARNHAPIRSGERPFPDAP